MGRARRVIVEGKPYELCFRAQQGLPLPPTKTTNVLLEGIIARTQRDNKVTLSNFIFMNNHAHMMVIPEEPENLPRFYGEIQKKTTDSLKALLQRRSMLLWQDRATVMMVADIDDCIERLVYIFTNPAKSHLVDSIKDYPGLSSWKAFTTCEPRVDASLTQEAHWFPVDTIPSLPTSRVLTPTQDKDMVAQLESAKEKVPHTLEIKPFAWIALYNITAPSDIEAIRQRVISRVYEVEAEIREKRKEERRKVLGAALLPRIPFMANHLPKKTSTRIFILCKDTERRIGFISLFKSIFERCRECYEKLKEGVSLVWPPGTFIPFLPPKLAYSTVE